MFLWQIFFVSKGCSKYQILLTHRCAWSDWNRNSCRGIIFSAFDSVLFCDFNFWPQIFVDWWSWRTVKFSILSWTVVSLTTENWKIVVQILNCFSCFKCGSCDPIRLPNHFSNPIRSDSDRICASLLQNQQKVLILVFRCNKTRGSIVLALCEFLTNSCRLLFHLIILVDNFLLSFRTTCFMTTNCASAQTNSSVNLCASGMD